MAHKKNTSTIANAIARAKVEEMFPTKISHRNMLFCVVCRAYYLPEPNERHDCAMAQGK